MFSTENVNARQHPLSSPQSQLRASDAEVNNAGLLDYFFLHFTSDQVSSSFQKN